MTKDTEGTTGVIAKETADMTTKEWIDSILNLLINWVLFKDLNSASSFPEKYYLLNYLLGYISPGCTEF
ncbi:1724_t:CDS:2 [Diversispora eburnea]|uniref:1724_t:CDS:1 n=1 Tax=Diversispora eburnea TaxID=1213867 RepID=A0A9N9C9J0_9GLOM|nr:1724_t:CDS:2 [Diversispora eburnea]